MASTSCIRRPEPILLPLMVSWPSRRHCRVHPFYLSIARELRQYQNIDVHHWPLLRRRLSNKFPSAARGRILDNDAIQNP
jgi:hypothetical protein